MRRRCRPPILPAFPNSNSTATATDFGPQPVRRSAWLQLLSAILTWFGSVLLLVFVPAIVVVPYLIYLWRTSGLPNAEALANNKTVLFLSILGIVPTHLLTLLLVWLVVTEGRKRPFWKTVGFEWPESVGQ
jgi:hypothetical protein